MFSKVEACPEGVVGGDLSERPGTQVIGANEVVDSRTGRWSSRIRRAAVIAVALTVGATSVATQVEADHTPPAATDDNPCDDFVISDSTGRRTSNQHVTVVQRFSNRTCELEQRILAEIAAERGVPLTLAVRDEILSYGRGDVRVRLFDELLQIAAAPPASRDAAEQRALDWFVERYRAARVDMATKSVAEYNRWRAEQCSYTPPAGATFTVTVTGMTATGTVSAEVAAAAAVDDVDQGSAASTSTDNVVSWIRPLELSLPGGGSLSVDNDPRRAGAVVDYTVESVGGVGPVTISCAPVSGSFFPIGETTVSCEATDAGTAVAALRARALTEEFTVAVRDVEDPTIEAGNDLRATSSNGEPVSVGFSAPVASDNSGAATVACSPTSGSSFPVGASTVTCTATDAAGNSAASTFEVIVSTAATPTGTPTPGSPGAVIPATGSDLVRTLAAALALLLLGGFMIVATRRRRAAGAHSSWWITR